MRIAQICDYKPPAKDSMGAERIIERLTQGLVAQGHEVTMVFSAGTKASPVRGASLAQSLDSKAYDVIHYHGWDPERYERETAGTPWVTTIHGYQLHQEQARAKNNPSVVAVSRFAAREINAPNFVWNCSCAEEFQYSGASEDYFVWMAGTDWGEGKGLFTTIELAKRMRCKLKIAGTGRIRDIIDLIKYECDERIEYVGPVNGVEKVKLLQGAKALILLTRLPDACPVTVSEALMCGTPVIASNCGSMPEIVQHGKTGMVCDNPLEAMKAMASIKRIDRSACRAYAQKHFSIEAAANKYVSIYKRAIAASAAVHPQHSNAVHAAP